MKVAEMILTMNLSKLAHSVTFMLIIFLSGCQSNELTEEEIRIQGLADSEVAAILFDSGLDNHASYNVHKDGGVVIKFDQSVSEKDYTAVVEALRGTQAIKSVYATQGGRQVCPLKSIR
jgi:hypothetical protein